VTRFGDAEAGFMERIAAFEPIQSVSLVSRQPILILQAQTKELRFSSRYERPWAVGKSLYAYALA
jgi:hypothetical protein